jgi:hypothetical protein
MAQLGKMWREDYAKPEQREKWVKEAEKDKARYLREKEERGEEEEDKPKKAKKKNPGAVTKNKTAYMFFSQEMRPQVKKENPDMDSREIMKELGVRWAAQTDRTVWEEQAKADKARYAKQIEERPMADESEDQEEKEESPQEQEEKKVPVKSKRAQKTEDDYEETEEEWSVKPKPVSPRGKIVTTMTFDEDD